MLRCAPLLPEMFRRLKLPRRLSDPSKIVQKVAVATKARTWRIRRRFVDGLALMFLPQERLLWGMKSPPETTTGIPARLSIPPMMY